MAEATGDDAAPTFVLVPDPPLPVDRAALAALATIRTVAHHLVVTTDAHETAAIVLRRLFEARCDVVTIAAIGGAAGRPAAELDTRITALLRRPLRWPQGCALAGLVFDWGEPIERLDPHGAHALPRRAGGPR